jgi:hypothetical protein
MFLPIELLLLPIRKDLSFITVEVVDKKGGNVLDIFFFTPFSASV